ncbi:MAG TPA: hypothetical protein VK966_09005 [Longimicrobiales bacterium]|nr:hypothetical protein [Longimicrobiales bacterium]
MTEPDNERTDSAGELAEEVRRTCVAAALQAYEDAGMQGLCPEGRWEAAISAMRAVDVRRLIREHDRAER